MIINEEGTYTLKYTATDECGKSSTVDRELVVTDNSPRRTVLYTDGTLIINERQVDEAHNIELHGAATNVYVAFDPNGVSLVERYIFSSTSDRPWDNEVNSIKTVEIGSEISPTSTENWFYNFATCTSMNLSKLDTSNVTDMSHMFDKCLLLGTLDLSNFNTQNVTTMHSMFISCEVITSIEFGDDFNTSSVTQMHSMFRDCRMLSSIDLSGFNTGGVKNMSYMFYNCFALTSINISGFDTSLVTNMSFMFYHCDSLTSLDLSSFKTNSVTNMEQMFRYCASMQTIYASSDFVVSQVTSDANMFVNMSSNLVGGAGTTWASSKPKDKTYAHIDGGTSDPGYFTAKS